MMHEPSTDERLALLLRELPPAPEGWVAAAAALPEVVSALERDADVDPTPERLAALRVLVRARRQ